jgi:hypothetical protein
MGKRNWHDRAYVNPLLILEASQVSICKSQKSLPLPYAWFLLWKMSLVHISKLCLQVTLNHYIRLFSEKEIQSYQAPSLMDHPSWNGNTMLFVWKFKHSHMKLQCISKFPFSQIIETICYALFLKGCGWACLQAFKMNYTNYNMCLITSFSKELCKHAMKIGWNENG